MESLILSVIKLWLVLFKQFLQKEKKYLVWEIIRFNAFMGNRKPTMKWKKLYQLRLNLKQSKSLLLLLKIKQQLNLLNKMLFKLQNNKILYILQIALQKKFFHKLNLILKLQINKTLHKINNNKNLDNQKFVLMHMLNIKPLMKLIKLFHLLIITIQDGQQMFVNFKNIIQSTVLIVKLLKKLRSQHKLAQIQNQIKLKKVKNLVEVRIGKKNSKKYYQKFKNGVGSIKHLMKFQIN